LGWKKNESESLLTHAKEVDEGGKRRKIISSESFAAIKKKGKNV
jgi:hypothetical protein